MMIVSRVRKMGSKGGIPTSFSDCLLHLSNLDLLRTVLSCPGRKHVPFPLGVISGIAW